MLSKAEKCLYKNQRLSASIGRKAVAMQQPHRGAGLDTILGISQASRASFAGKPGLPDAPSAVSTPGSAGGAALLP